MRTWSSDLAITLRPGDAVELRVVDLSLARAFFEGIPAARLLARMRLASDERDLENTPSTKTSTSSWEALLTRVLGGSPAAAERAKRAIARHARAASDEGPLPPEDGCVAALAFALAVSGDPDASPSEIVGAEPRGDRGEPNVARACSAFEPRLGSAQSDRRAILFEACARLATRAIAGPWPAARVREALDDLAGSDLRMKLRPASVALFPLAFDADVQVIDRRMTLLERAELDALVAKDPRELAAAIARARRGGAGHADALVADLTTLLRRPGELVIAARPPPPEDESTPLPSVRPSWMPTDWTSYDAIATLADAVERGATTVPRLRGIVARGGEPALDALGAEMLRVAAHPFASAAFADVLAKSGRPRDVIRLVTYFAIAPDPTSAAHALASCVAPELPSVLRAWLEAMLPSDGAQAPHGENPETSSAARLTACVAALAPYPRLYGAVRPLLARVSEAPPPNSSDGPTAL
jgi:hypothetical protein